MCLDYNMICYLKQNAQSLGNIQNTFFFSNYKHLLINQHLVNVDCVSDTG